MHAVITFAATLACLIGVVSASSAETITLEAVSRGTYDDTGVFASGFSGTLSGNYLTGEFSAFGLIRELRSFFVFDLTGISDQIEAGTFDVSAGFYVSVDSFETLSLFDVGSSLTALTNNTGGTGAFVDLGSGVTYGARVFTGTEPVLLPPTSISLNASALADLNSTSGLFGIGGALTSITGTSLQVVFGGTVDRIRIL